MADRTPDRDAWARINDIFHRALDQPAAARPDFVLHTCGGDGTLARRIIALLQAHDRGADALETPLLSLPSLMSRLVEGLPSASSGDVAVPERIGPYRVLRVIGKGGMGIVYLAEDTRLGRTVALKAVSPKFTGDDSRRERLRREARAAASLTHPGIATVFALEEFDDHLYLACEFVDGETMREVLARGPLGPTPALDAAIAIAQALAAAHDRGVIHRDIKPENIIRSTSGTIKILDFGLARLSDPAHTLDSLTDDGMVVGTPAYMSPEQTRGQTVDFRSDLFSFGIVLRELVTGTHPFAGGSIASTIVNILEAEPASIAVQPTSTAPAGLEWIDRISSRCLKKDPASRYASTHALVTALEAAKIAIAAGHRSPATSSTGSSSTSAKDPTWWWQFHQAAVTVVYCALLIPAWLARQWVGAPAGQFQFLVALVAVIVASTLRLHLWFTLRSYPAEWRVQQNRSARWIRIADVGLAAAMLLAAGFLFSNHGDIAMVFVAVAVAIVLSSTIIEPATTRAAFGQKDTST